MYKDYLPKRLAELVTWATNFSTLITATPTEFGLTATDATVYNVLRGDFAAAYQTAQDPATRSPTNIQLQKAAKDALIAETRRLVGTVQSAAGMTNAKRSQLGITLRGNEPTPVGPPVVMPVLRIAAVEGRLLNLELRREDGTTKAKPVGVKSAWLYTFVGETPSPELSQWQFRGGTTKSNPQVMFPETVPAGSPVWVTALWVSPTEQPGPACAPVKTHVNFAGLNNVAA